MTFDSQVCLVLGLSAVGAGGSAEPVQDQQASEAICVADAATGEPITGARVSAVLEAECPQSGVWWSARSATSDADGCVRMGLDDLPGWPWLFVEAEGYAPLASLSREPVLSLARGVDVELEVRDALERPVAGAQVGLMLGCGHAPDVRSVRTDAQGRATLVSIQPGAGDLWVVGPGLRADYGGEEQEGALLVVRCAPGVDAIGRVVDARGAPVAGAFVGQPRRHRGPWTRTAADGGFRLRGAEPPVEVLVRDGADPSRLLGVFELPSDGRPRTLSVPPPEEPTATLTVELRWAREAAQPPEVRVEAVRARDGFTAGGLALDGDEVELALPPGRYTVATGGSLSGWDPTRQTVQVGAGPVGIVLELSPSPRALLRAPWLGASDRVVLVTRTEERDVSDAVRAGETVAVPRDGLCGVRTRAGAQVRALVLSPERRRADVALDLERP